MSSRRVLDEEPAADLAVWFDRHVDAVHRYVARRVGGNLARDVVAETFRIAVEHVDGYDAARGSERSWLFGIATNLVRRHWRSEERRLRAYAATARRSEVHGDPLLAVEDSVDAGRRLDRLVDAVARLSPEDRDVLVLVAWEGMSSADVAAVLGVPHGTVRSRLSRVRAQLRAHETTTGAGAHDDG
jgi:RNA polymerase sigma factor (sigma-70 family)